jgi:microcystin degradation protein MlrC
VKVFIACLGTETNTFSPIPTGYETFAESMLFDGDATRQPANLFSEPLIVWRDMAEAMDAEVIESLAAFAQPAGPTVRRVYEGFRDRILADLKAALPVDMVLINMHGAMVADGYPDCEGDLLGRIRALVGPQTIVGGELDLHCSITQAMIGAADVLITFKEYPHIDGRARAEELFTICDAARRGAVRPEMSVRDLRMINMWRTTEAPGSTIVSAMQEAERRNDILSVSFAHGFPWGDVPEASAKVLVVSDNAAPAGSAVAEDIADLIWQQRDGVNGTLPGVADAVQMALAAPQGPVVLADVADNAGGGAPSDSTFILSHLLEIGATGVLSGFYWDPVAVRFCFEAGEGASLALRIGGKCGPESGQPIDLKVTVRGLVADAKQSFGSASQSMGRAAWVSSGGVDLILNENRTQVFHPDGFTQFGLDLAKAKIIVVKSTQHFHAGFAPIAGKIIYVAAPGAIPPDFANIPFEVFQQPFWPRVAEPFAKSSSA